MTEQVTVLKRPKKFEDEQPWPTAMSSDLQAQGVQLVANLQILYGSVLENRALNWKLWRQTRDQIIEWFHDWMREQSFHAPPFLIEEILAELAPAAPVGFGNVHIALLEAMTRDVQQLLKDQIRYRLYYNGNVHLAFEGPTGMVKTSCAITVADWTKPIRRGNLAAHITIDVSELPAKFKDKERGDTVILDEVVRKSGQGSRTDADMADNMEDTIRHSGKNLIRISPRQQERGTMQGALRVMLWSPERLVGVFMLWLGDHPIGIIVIPFSPAELNEEYGPIKEENTQQMLAGRNKDHRRTARLANELCDSERFVRFMEKCVNKPRLKDFRAAVEYIPLQAMDTKTADQLANFLYDMCYGWDRFKDEYEELWELPPSPGLARIAVKCYEE